MNVYHFGFAGLDLKRKKEHIILRKFKAVFSGLSFLELKLNNSFRFHVESGIQPGWLGKDNLLKRTDV